MLADLIREFCKERNYEVYENYTKTVTTPLGDETFTTIGIIVKGDRGIVGELNDFLGTKELTGQIVDELEGFPSADELGPDTYVYYFPMIQDYQPPQP